LARISKSFLAIPKEILIPLTSILLALLSLAFFSCWYWYFPKSMIRQTGGTALSATSIKSSPLSTVNRTASSNGTTPIFSPLAPMSRTSFALI
jgi:hypothetical protein